jgi:SAM-dependent methyltransferase
MTETSSSPDTPESWGAASRGYAEEVAPLLMRAFADPLIERLDVGENDRVLEVGAGSGALTEVLFPRVKSLVATDFAPRMIDVLRERLEALGAPNVRCEIMDGQALECEDSSFDAAACSFALMLFPNRQKGFSELCRVVRPTGRVAVSAWAGPEKFEAFGLFLAALDAAFPDMPPPPTPPPVFSLADPAEFKLQMEAAGFRNVEVEFVARDLEVPDFEKMWSMLTVGAPPVQILFDRIGSSGKERVREQLYEIIDKRFGAGPIKMTNVATVGSGSAI